MAVGAPTTNNSSNTDDVGGFFMTWNEGNEPMEKDIPRKFETQERAAAAVKRYIQKNRIPVAELLLNKDGDIIPLQTIHAEEQAIPAIEAPEKQKSPVKLITTITAGVSFTALSIWAALGGKDATNQPTASIPGGVQGNGAATAVENPDEAATVDVFAGYVPADVPAFLDGNIDDASVNQKWQQLLELQQKGDSEIEAGMREVMKTHVRETQPYLSEKDVDTIVAKIDFNAMYKLMARYSDGTPKFTVEVSKALKKTGSEQTIVIAQITGVNPAPAGEETPELDASPYITASFTAPTVSSDTGLAFASYSEPGNEAGSLPVALLGGIEEGDSEEGLDKADEDEIIAMMRERDAKVKEDFRSFLSIKFSGKE